MFTKSEELAIHNHIISNEIKNQLFILKHKLTIKFDSYEVVPNLEIGKDFDKKLGSLDYRVKLDSYNVYYKGALLGAEFSEVLEGVDEAKQLVEERFGTTNKVVTYQAALNEYNEEIEEIRGRKEQALESLIIDTTFYTREDTFEPVYTDDLKVVGYKLNGTFHKYDKVIETIDDLKKFIDSVKKD